MSDSGKQNKSKKVKVKKREREMGDEEFQDFRESLQVFQTPGKPTDFVLQNLGSFKAILSILTKEFAKTPSERQSLFIRLFESIVQALSDAGCFSRQLQIMGGALPGVIRPLLQKKPDLAILTTLREVVAKWNVLHLFKPEDYTKEELALLQSAIEKGRSLSPASTGKTTGKRSRSSPNGEISPIRRKKIKSEEEWEDDPLLSRVPTSDAEWLKYIELDRRRDKKRRWEASLRPKSDPSNGEFNELWEREMIPQALKKRVENYLGKTLPPSVYNTSTNSPSSAMMSQSSEMGPTGNAPQKEYDGFVDTPSPLHSPDKVDMIEEILFASEGRKESDEKLESSTNPGENRSSAVARTTRNGKLG